MNEKEFGKLAQLRQLEMHLGVKFAKNKQEIAMECVTRKVVGPAIFT